MRYIALISDGLDSPVAAYKALTHGHHEVCCLNLVPSANDDRYVEKIIKIAHSIADAAKRPFSLYMAPYDKVMAKIRASCPPKLYCVICKRCMYRVAETAAEMLGCNGIITGEVLGQVASQTLQNLAVIESAIKLPVFRPLIGYDKEAIVKTAKAIGLYDIVIRGQWKCWLVPKHPSVSAKLQNVREIEESMDITEVIKDVIKNAKAIDVEPGGVSAYISDK